MGSHFKFISEGFGHCNVTQLAKHNKSHTEFRLNNSRIKKNMLGRAVSIFGRNALRMQAGQRAIRGDMVDGPGLNMPFQTKNKTRLLFVISTYLGFGFSIPFIAVRFQMKKKSMA